jgi:hypothetical protein
MRKISDIIKIKNELLKYSDTTKLLAEGEAMNNLLGTVDSYEVQSIGKLVDHGTMKLAGRVYQAVNDIAVALDMEITNIATTLSNRSYIEFTTSIDDERNNRKIVVPATIQDILHGRIRLYVDWHYPGLEIGPHDGELTPHLVGCDPLYLADSRQEYLDCAVTQFPEEYVNRVRKYVVDYAKGDQTLLQLPPEQFGFIFSWNYFNYLPFSIITCYLQDAFTLLAPGGTFMFGFNDAGMVNGAKHVEWGGMAYMTKEMLTSAASDIGYEITSTSHGFDCGWHNISWLEIKKPGILSTIKAHQTMGIIKDIG